MKNYERRAYYHETDQMGIIHHSNYLKWMEEARIDFTDQLGFSYKKMEALGVMSPVLGIQVEYKNSVHFDDTVYFIIQVEEYNGVKLTLKYEIYNKANDEICAIGKSKHCFIQNGRVVSLKKALPEFHTLFENLLKQRELQ